MNPRTSTFDSIQCTFKARCSDFGTRAVRMTVGSSILSGTYSVPPLSLATDTDAQRHERETGDFLRDLLWRHGVVGVREDGEDHELQGIGRVLGHRRRSMSAEGQRSTGAAVEQLVPLQRERQRRCRSAFATRSARFVQAREQ